MPRLSAKDLPIKVAAAPLTSRPIRVRTAGLVFAFTTPEAIELAHALADAVAEVNRIETGATEDD